MKDLAAAALVLLVIIVLVYLHKASHEGGLHYNVDGVDHVLVIR